MYLDFFATQSSCLLQFVIDFPNEYIQSVEATNDKPKLFRNTVITSIKLETSKGRTSIFGYEVGKKFMLVKTGYSLVGFHGKEGEAIDALGAYFENVLTSPTPTASIPGILATCGGEGGSEWDDDVYEGVRKVYVGQDLSRITYIKFDYVKFDGEVVTREYGTESQHPKEFEVQYPDEHIISVEGSYKKVDLYATDVITSLVFKTSKGRKSPMFGPNLLGLVTRTNFFFFFLFGFEDQGKKIVGFHGRSGDALDALGVYFVHDSLTTSLPPLYKLDAQGGTEGLIWDDGSYDAVKTLRICQDDCRIAYLEFEYDKGGKSEKFQHGVKGGTPAEFVLDYPDEYIKTVEATYDKPKLFQNTVITSLTFQTSKGRASFFGYKVGKKFVLEQKDRRLVGFHGTEGDAIDALGAYFAPIPAPTPLIPAKKLPSVRRRQRRSYMG
ncbi:unnamed protein product [Brassica oleracea var. botrytis]|uniref:(rape) hypothetical protein n=1 Tax=Brassica napus TaxID=3708 RepID=A0A816JGX5_BRANA|nr:unnamed protein product [Brassica napus]